jgi:uncharacterized membrane protein
MSNDPKPGHQAPGHNVGLERMVFFSDAVFAIVITLLILDIRLPPSSVRLGEAETLAMLRDLMPKFVAYLLTFCVVGLIWLGHHRKFLSIRNYDAGLLRLNLLQLLVVCFIPFAASVISESPTRTAWMLYCLTMVVAELMSGLLWAYAERRALVIADVPRWVARQNLYEPLKTCAVFVLSALVTPWSLDCGRWLMLLLIPASIVVKGAEIRAPKP